MNLLTWNQHFCFIWLKCYPYCLFLYLPLPPYGARIMNLVRHIHSFDWETIRTYLPTTKFVSVKGNHDITGPGARKGYENAMLPWLSEECGKRIASASFFFMQGPDLFVLFDAYHDNKLDWVERTLRDNKYIEHFEFANFPGHAITNVSDAGVNADVYVGASDKMWKSTSLK